MGGSDACGLGRRGERDEDHRAHRAAAAGFSEWGRELDEWRAQGIERWAAIERPDGRVVDFLLDHGVVYPVACDKSLRHVVDQVAFLSLLSSAWARAYYDQQRARGHAHHQALRALGAKWLKIIFVMWHRQVPYDEQYHLATMTRQQLRQRQKQIA